MTLPQKLPMLYNRLHRLHFLLLINLRVLGGFLYPAGAGLFVPAQHPLFTNGQL